MAELLTQLQDQLHVVSQMFFDFVGILQRDAPPHSRGRVLSIFQAFSGVTYGLGLLLLGAVGDLTDLRVSFVLGAVLNLLYCLVLAWRLPRWRSAMDGPLLGDSPPLATA